MGTRADFYIGTGRDAEWLGSVAWDGYPGGIDEPVLAAATESEYRAAVASFFTERGDATLPGSGWPWPWNDSGTTDYAYAFDNGKVMVAPFGRGWFAVDVVDSDDRGEPIKICSFPDMSKAKSVAMGPRSGLIVLG